MARVYVEEYVSATISSLSLGMGVLSRSRCRVTEKPNSHGGDDHDHDDHGHGHGTNDVEETIGAQKEILRRTTSTFVACVG